ncbi:MAG: 60S ribosomal protein L22 [Candidatus Hermodarchaeota archaeon]
MSEINKAFTINVKDLSFKSEQHVLDLIRFLSEALPQIKLNRNGNDINVEMPIKLSKRTLKLRIKKFLHKNNLSNNFRPISYQTVDSKGYMLKEKKLVELSYY